MTVRAGTALLHSGWASLCLTVTRGLLCSCVICHDPGPLLRMPFSIYPQSIPDSSSRPQGGGNRFYRPTMLCLGTGWRESGQTDSPHSQCQEGSSAAPGPANFRSAATTCCCCHYRLLPRASAGVVCFLSVKRESLLSWKSKQTP